MVNMSNPYNLRGNWKWVENTAPNQPQRIVLKKYNVPRERSKL